MKSKTTIVLLSVVIGLGLGAGPVTEQMAAKAAGNWRVRKGQLGAKLGARVRDARRIEHKGTAFHVVRFEGGGYVVMPSDTAVRPVILFSEGGDLAVDDRNPALALLVNELSSRLASEQDSIPDPRSPTPAEASWLDLLDDRLPLEMAGKPEIDDVRVAPIVKTQWSQLDVGGELCYNYYTPSNCYCGCVATAGSQILKTLRFPTEPVKPFKKACRYNGDRLWRTSQGGTYDWDNLPDVPTAATPEAQRQAIGKLTSDMGIGVGMAYGDGGSGSKTLMLQYAFKTWFGLSHVALGFAPNYGTSPAIDDNFGEVLRANFDAGLPVAIGLSNHSIVGDGYGYLGDTLYYHLNMGWGPGSNVWYAPPDDFGSYTGFDYACYNIYTNAAMNELVIASGRLTDGEGQPVAGVTVWAEDAGGNRIGNAALSDEHGIYALYVPPGEYRVRAHRVLWKGVREVGELHGETTARPLACSTAEAHSDDSFDPGTTWIQGNDSGCDMVLSLSEYEPIVSVGFSGEATFGTDFASVEIPVSACVSRFGRCDVPITVSVTLLENGAPLMVWEKDIKDTVSHRFTAAFDGLQAGTVYTYRAAVLSGDETLAETGVGEAVAAREVRVSEPQSAVLASEDIMVDLSIAAFSVFELLTNVTASAAVTAFERDDGTGEFAVWTGSAWSPTGVTAERRVTSRVAILRRTGEAPRYRLWREGCWIELGDTPAMPPQLTEAVVDGTASVLAMQGVDYDANRLLCTADGTEYADVTAVLGAGELRTLTPLWSTVGTMPDDVKLAVLSVFDPSGLLTLTGGTLLKQTTAPDGTVTYSYGTMDPKEVQSSDYLKATCALGLSHAIQTTSEVTLADASAAEGSLSFKVSVDDERVTRERVKDFVRVTDDLKSDWRVPVATEIAVKDGTVTVTPDDDRTRVFVKVEFPKD